MAAAPRCRSPPGGAKAPVKLGTALRVEPAARNTLIASIGLSMMVLCTIDLLQVYLPALGVERGIPTQSIGVLLALRAAATVLSRLGMDRLVRAVGRARLLLVSTGVSALLVGLLVLDLPVPWMAVLLVLAGLGLGAGPAVEHEVVSAAATEGTRGTWMSIRLLGNRLGQAVIPVGVGVFATTLGAGGVFLVLGVAHGGGDACGPSPRCAPWTRLSPASAGSGDDGGNRRQVHLRRSAGFHTGVRSLSMTWARMPSARSDAVHQVVGHAQLPVQGRAQVVFGAGRTHRGQRALQGRGGVGRGSVPRPLRRRRMGHRIEALKDPGTSGAAKAASIQGCAAASGEAAKEPKSTSSPAAISGAGIDSKSGSASMTSSKRAASTSMSANPSSTASAPVNVRSGERQVFAQVPRRAGHQVRRTPTSGL